MNQARLCRVQGRVQGVWYRASTQKMARQLGINGYAKNMADGSVEVLMCGPKDALDSLSDWLWKGSTASKVTDVVCTVWNGDIPTSFTTN